MIRKAESINTLGYSFSDVILFHATGVATTIGMIVIITPHTKGLIKLEEKEVTCNCKSCKDKNNKERSAELSLASEAASLLQVLGDRILLLLSGLLELSNPLNISLCDIVALTDSLGLVCKTIAKVSVLNESGKNLVTIGCESCVIKSVDVLGNTVRCYTKLLTAKLIKLEEVCQELFISFSAHDYKPHLKIFFLHTHYTIYFFILQ